MKIITFDPNLLKNFASKTAIVTGAANGIGAETSRLLNSHGANVVIADLESTRSTAEALIASLPHPSNAVFIPASIIDWSQMKALFRKTIERFGRVELVVANAGVMESSPVLDLDHVDEKGELVEAVEGFRVIDINMKGTLNTLRLALYHMKSNPLNTFTSSDPPFTQTRGSVVLIASTSGYFGGTGVSAYVASKHGVIGLLRACQLTAAATGVRVNGVAPFFTPTRITAGFAEAWKEKGLEANTPQGVAGVIAGMAVDGGVSGRCCLTCGGILREMEDTSTELLPTWLGEDVAELMSNAMKLLTKMGGYPLPKLS